MKLSRHDLIHAKDTQLRALGLNRSHNPGWMQRALDREFTEAEMQLFHAAREKTIKTEKVGANDANVESVRDKLQQRMNAGFKKYGVTTERTDLSRKQWLIHAQEEALDLAVYLERLIREEVQ